MCKDFEAELVEFNDEAHHIHLLVNFPPEVAVSRPVNSLKGVSSRRPRQEFPNLIRHYRRAQRLWSGSYFARSVDGAPLSIVIHRAAEPAAPTRAEANSADPCTQLGSEQFSDSLHHRAEARCTANKPGSRPDHSATDTPASARCMLLAHHERQFHHVPPPPVPFRQLRAGNPWPSRPLLNSIRPQQHPMLADPGDPRSRLCARPHTKVSAWLEGRGGRPEAHCHREMLDQCREVKRSAAMSRVGEMWKGPLLSRGSTKIFLREAHGPVCHGRNDVFAPDHIGELTQVIPPELVDAVLDESGPRERRLRSLPSRVGVYFVLALGLFEHLGTGLVWGKLAAGLGARVPQPSEKALRDLRRRVGATGPATADSSAPRRTPTSSPSLTP
ncbi:hypothetical protein GCM10020367_65420 [Streptomyces sannanensis]|uniref:Transposase IS200-like domain-containing protein n=1 Tax=Streptomyces sannanensis TaxID=285536 RepID=A0ABP6S445_9ACTN